MPQRVRDVESIHPQGNSCHALRPHKRWSWRCNCSTNHLPHALLQPFLPTSPPGWMRERQLADAIPFERLAARLHGPLVTATPMRFFVGIAPEILEQQKEMP